MFRAKNFIPLLVCLSAITSIFANDTLQNSYLRNGISLNGRWHYIVDVYENGYYNYRWEPHDSSENPGSGAFYLNAKPKDKMDLVEYDFDAAPTINVPGDWNSQKEKLFYYEGTVWYKKSFTIPNFDPSKRYYIRFGAVNYQADVYVNGHRALRSAKLHLQKPIVLRSVRSAPLPLPSAQPAPRAGQQVYIIRGQAHLFVQLTIERLLG